MPFVISLCIYFSSFKNPNTLCVCLLKHRDRHREEQGGRFEFLTSGVELLQSLLKANCMLVLIYNLLQRKGKFMRPYCECKHLKRVRRAGISRQRVNSFEFRFCLCSAQNDVMKRRAADSSNFSNNSSCRRCFREFLNLELGNFFSLLFVSFFFGDAARRVCKFLTTNLELNKLLLAFIVKLSPR